MNTETVPAIKMNDTELSSQINGTREVALVSCAPGGQIVFELYEGEAYEGRTLDGRYAQEWLEAAE